MNAKTVKVSTRKPWQNSERRVELYDTTPEGKRGWSILCRADEFPHTRAGVATRWMAGPICGPSDKPMRWWTAY